MISLFSLGCPTDVDKDDTAGGGGEPAPPDSGAPPADPVAWTIGQPVDDCGVSYQLSALPTDPNNTYFASRLVPPGYPYTASHLHFSMIDFGEGQFCANDMPFLVVGFVGDELFPDAEPEPLFTVDGSTLEREWDGWWQSTYDLPLDAPIELEAGQFLYVAIEIPYADDYSQAVCINACVAAGDTPYQTYWSQTNTEPYAWLDWYVAGNVALPVWADGMLAPGFVEGECDDGGDDDGDSLVDCTDDDCFGADACRVCPDGDAGSALGDGIFTGTTDGETYDVATSCTYGHPGDVAFDWVAPSTGVFAFDTLGSEVTPTLAVLASCDGDEVTCATPYDVDNPSARLELEAGQSVVVVAQATDWSASGGFQINARASTCPSGGLAGSLGQAVASGTTDRTVHDVLPSCAPAYGDETWSWTAPADGVYRFTASADFAAVLFVLDGGCAGAELACEATASGVGYVDVSVVAGQTLIVGVAGQMGTTGEYAIDVEEGLCDSGDVDLGSAMGDAVVTADLTGAPALFAPSCSSSSDHQLSYAWTAPADATYTFDTTASAIDTVLQIRDECGFEELACDDDAGGNATSTTSLAMTAGETVQIVVGGYGTTEGTAVLGIH
ncbi:MAG: hypothetical protein FJ102_24185 [Deltaproteobacteria bacterium]|nr:hypothetical protein [Deltaproteobacteria bacterium]